MPCCASTPRDPRASTTGRVPAGPSGGPRGSKQIPWAAGLRPAPGPSEVAQLFTLEATMEVVSGRPEPSTAIRSELGAVFVSLELSRSNWLITSLSPGNGETMSKHAVRSGDTAG